MGFSSKSGFFILFFTVSCAKHVKQNNSESYAFFYQSSSVEEKNRYISCNVFADETFRGYVWQDSKSSVHNEECIYLDIVKSPKGLLRNEDLFLQIYPFSIDNEGINYGSSFPIRTVRKPSTNDEEEDILVLSQIIDTYLVETELDLETDHFFLDHVFKICDVGEEWDGLQLVIYERRNSPKEPIPVRVSKFLIPPFLIHPEHFRDTHGEALAAFHPLLEYIPQIKSRPSEYYDLAKNLCISVL